MSYQAEVEVPDDVKQLLYLVADVKPLVDQVGVKSVADIVAIVKLVLEVIAALRKLRS